MKERRNVKCNTKNERMKQETYKRQYEKWKKEKRNRKFNIKNETKKKEGENSIR